MEQVNYVHVVQYKQIEEDLYNRLERLGLIPNEVRQDNVGKSDYSKHTIQPWSIWLDYNLNAWDADIVKRVLRTKEEPGMPYKDSRIMDYNKIIHICKERIRQLESEPEVTFTSTVNYHEPVKCHKAMIESLSVFNKNPKNTLPESDKATPLEVPITYELQGTELIAYNRFNECHKNCEGPIQVIFSHEGGIGRKVHMYCDDCGVEEDITDYSQW